MLLPDDIAPLIASADDIIADCLRNGGVTPANNRLLPPRYEVDALKVFLFCATRRIAQHWGHVLRRKYRLQMTSVLTHQTPMANYWTIDPGYQHAARMRPRPKGDWTCELADLLVVMDFPQRNGRGVERQAALVQGKRAPPRQFRPSQDELTQHHLLACWPVFDLDASPGFRKGPRNLRGLSRKAAVYGMIELPGGPAARSRWTMCKPQSRGAYLRPWRRSLGQWLAELAAGKEGHAADTIPFRQTKPARRSPLTWRKLVDELLEVTAKELVSVGGTDLPRGQSHLIQMLDATAIRPDYWVEEIGPHLPPPVWPVGPAAGGEPGAPGLPEPDDDRPRFGVLHIRFDPVEG